jgi:glutamate-1-semialdehyde 2,1-aminomutase
MTKLNSATVQAMRDREQHQFGERHPSPRASIELGQRHCLYGAPSHWMRRWAGGCPRTGFETLSAQVPEDIAYPMLYLASAEVRWMTGHTIAVDGGSTLPDSGYAMEEQWAAKQGE